MSFIVYNILYVIFFPLILVIGLLFNRIRFKFYQRFGLFPKSKIKIWVHCASYGEINGIYNFIKKLLEKEKSVCISVLSNTGYKRARELFPELNIFLLPLDFFPLIYFIMRKLSPQILILDETEIWPSLVYSAFFIKCKIYLINARISDKSFRTYLILKPLFKKVLRLLDFIYLQNNDSYRRFVKLGYNPKKIKYIGNTKFDLQTEKLSNQEKIKLKRYLKIDRKSIVLIAGSIRDGEEEIFLDVCMNLKQKFKNLKIILVPRHLDKINNFKNALIKRNLKFCNYSSLQKADCVIIDRMGLLLALYNICDIAFIGGTLIPIGGHNPLEASACSKVTVFGKYIENNKSAYELLIKNKVGFMAKTKEELENILIYLFSNKKKLKALGRKAYRVTSSVSGISTKLIKEIC